jgi:hypothetical protein
MADAVGIAQVHHAALILCRARDWQLKHLL